MMIFNYILTIKQLIIENAFFYVFTSQSFVTNGILIDLMWNLQKFKFFLYKNYKHY